MVPVLITILLALLSLFVGPWINHILARRREAENRKRDEASKARAAFADKERRKQDFHASIAGLRDEILGSKDGELVDKHKGSIGKFNGHCSRIEPDILNVVRFKKLCSDYRALTAADIECRDQSVKRPPNKDRFGNYQPVGNWQPPCRYEDGRARLKSLFEAVLDCAK